jgi:hypothetical protein
MPLHLASRRPLGLSRSSARHDHPCVAAPTGTPRDQPATRAPARAPSLSTLTPGPVSSRDVFRSSGIPVQVRPESAFRSPESTFRLRRNRCSDRSGIRVQVRPEYAADGVSRAQSTSTASGGHASRRWRRNVDAAASALGRLRREAHVRYRTNTAKMRRLPEAALPLYGPRRGPIAPGQRAHSE